MKHHTVQYYCITQEVTIALLPSTMHPQSRVKPHIHVRTGKFLTSVPPSPIVLYVYTRVKTFSLNVKGSRDDSAEN